MTSRRVHVAGLMAVAFAVSGCAIGYSNAPSSAPAAPEVQLAAFIRHQVEDSLGGYGPVSAGQIYAADRASYRLLLAADPQVRPPGGGPVLCPGSTDSAGNPMHARVGYQALVQFSRMAPADTLHVLLLGDACTLVKRGRRPWGFYHNVTWALGVMYGRWHVLRAMMVSIT